MLILYLVAETIVKEKNIIMLNFDFEKYHNLKYCYEYGNGIFKMINKCSKNKNNQQHQYKKGHKEVNKQQQHQYKKKGD